MYSILSVPKTVIMNASESKSYLRDKIVKECFKQEEIQKISNFAGTKISWIFDFKKVSMEKPFLEHFIYLFEDTFKDLEEYQICGLESGAVPFITTIALHSKKCKNAFYFRKSAKKSDLSHQVEGGPMAGIPLIIVDDILNFGNTFKKQIVFLEALEIIPYAVFSIIRYRNKEEYKDIFSKVEKVESIFEINDFTNDLKISNLLEPKPPNYDLWKADWKIKFSQHNPYIVVPKSAPASYLDYVYIGGDDGRMRCISKKDGTIQWESHQIFGGGGKRIFSSPVIGHGSVFFGGYDGNFYCLDALTGKQKWIFFDGDWIGSSPSISDDGKFVYIGLEFGLFKKHGGVAALDVKTGKLIWSFYGMSGLTHASPAVSKKLNVVVCGCNDGFVYCFNFKTGDLMWKLKTNGEVKYGAVFNEKKKLVVIGSMDGGLYCINTNTGEIYHKFEARFGFYSNAVLLENKIIIGSLDKNIYCFDLNQKKEIWKVTTRGRIFASPNIYKDNVFIGSNDGILYELQSESGEIVSVTQLTERIVNRAIVEYQNNKRVIYVSTQACELYKFSEI